MSRDPMQTNPAVLEAAMTTTTEPNCRIVHAKLFHHNNLVLQLLFDHHFNMYRINVYRLNDQSNTDLWGVYFDDDDGYARARAKFDSIQL